MPYESAPSPSPATCNEEVPIRMLLDEIQRTLSESADTVTTMVEGILGIQRQKENDVSPPKGMNEQIRQILDLAVKVNAMSGRLNDLMFGGRI